MPSVVIIGFSYSGDLRAVNDIYLVYSFYSKLNYSITVLSDVEKTVLPDDLTTILVEGLVEDDFVPFVNKKFEQLRTLVKSSEELQNSIEHAIQECEDGKLVFYYSGHGKKDHLVTPDQDSDYDIYNLRRQIQNSNLSSVLVILDCCYPSSLALPYFFDCGSEKIQRKATSFLTQKILLLCPCASSEKISSMMPFSDFTYSLIKYLRKSDKYTNFAEVTSDLSRNVLTNFLANKNRGNKVKTKEVVYGKFPTTNHISTSIQVYMSYPSIRNIWSWSYSEY